MEQWINPNCVLIACVICGQDTYSQNGRCCGCQHTAMVDTAMRKEKLAEMAAKRDSALLAVDGFVEEHDKDRAELKAVRAEVNRLRRKIRNLRGQLCAKNEM